MKPTQSESVVQKICLAILSHHKIPHWRINTMGVYDPTHGLFRKSVTKGVSDIIAIRPKTGQFVAIECKTLTGKLSAEQKDLLDSVESNGGIAFVARSGQAFLRFVQEDLL